MMVSESEGPVNGMDENRKKNIEELEDLISRGLKCFIVKDTDKAVDLFSDAARLADQIYGAFSPETFNAYLNYGRALAEWASDQYTVVKMKINDEVESSSEEEEEESTVEDGNEIEESNSVEEGNSVEESNEIEQSEETGEPANEEENLDEVDHILKDAWNVLEVAKETSERALKNVTEESEIKRWSLRLSDALYYLGQVLLLSDQSENAKVELTKSLEIKQKFSSEDDRELASNYYQIGKSFETALEYSESKKYYEMSLAIMKANLDKIDSSNGNNSNEDLDSICKDLEEKIENAVESQKAAAKFEGMAKSTLFGSKSSAAHALDSSDINDISNLVRKRRPASDSNDNETKKSKE